MIITSYLEDVPSKTKRFPRLRVKYNLHEMLNAVVRQLFSVMDLRALIPIPWHRNTARLLCSFVER